MSKCAVMGLLLLSLILDMPGQANALSSNWQRDGSVDVRLISGLEGVGQKTVVPLGLEVKLEPGWHIYWRSPGATGLPPQIDWTDSETDQGNLRQATLLFPVPQRFNEQGIDTVGYKNHVVFPIDAELRHPGAPLAINATLNLLACSDLCVPKNFRLALRIPADNAIEGEEADILNPARALVPTRNSRNGLTVTDITNTGTSLSVTISGQTTIAAPDLFVESQPEIPFGPPEWKSSPDLLSATLTVKPEDAQQDLRKLVDTPLLLTITDHDHALEISTTLPPVSEGSSPGTHPLLSLRTALWLAILGGFLLNLMPCVLPVLSLKILSLIGHGGGEKTAVRRSFLVSAAGILFSFMLLAVMTVILQKLGLVLGWGVQFQQPLFLICLILLLVLFAATMWDLITIGLPRFLADKLADHHPKMAGDFATGALATLLATPCTAPFMGTAVGFALASGSSWQIIAIFLALGFGMTLPYLVIALFPKAATLLPKPGLWMVRLRWCLGAALAATALWLLWVLSAQLLVGYATADAMCMIMIFVVLGLRHFGLLKSFVKTATFGFAIIAIGLAMAGTPPPVKNSGTASADGLWQAFDEAAIKTDVAAGKVVFVDITAAWCLTCKANQKLVLADTDINLRLFHGNIVTMQGDWTNPNPAITNFLHEYRRYGIPFNVVFGPGAPQGITLPEILSHDVVVEALDKAAAP